MCGRNYSEVLNTCVVSECVVLRIDVSHMGIKLRDAYIVHRFIVFCKYSLALTHFRFLKFKVCKSFLPCMLLFIQYLYSNKV